MCECAEQSVHIIGNEQSGKQKYQRLSELKLCFDFM